MIIDKTILNEAWKYLDDATVYFQGRPIGTVASLDTEMSSLNYNHVFTRDFFVSAMAFLLNDRHDIVKNFLIELVRLQGVEKQMDCFEASEGLMPASFEKQVINGEEHLTADFGEKAIGRVTPVDSSLWWLILLRTYTKITGDTSLAARDDFQQAIRLILDQYLTSHFELIPTILVPDGSFMIDRRLGLYGHPFDIEILFYTGLLSAREVLSQSEGNERYTKAITHRLGHLVFHLREYYWLDIARLNRIYRFGTEEFGEDASNRYNIFAAAIPNWIIDWLPDSGGYFVGNLGPGRMDFRFFTLGNLMAILSSLANKEQSAAIMNLVEERWLDLVGYMPVKICYPALEGIEWTLLTGSDPKNVPWSYHNAGSWPFLLWILTAVAIKTNRLQLAETALGIAVKRLAKDLWPEYYDGRSNRLVGKEARKLQSWTIAGFITAYTLLTDPGKVSLLAFEEEAEENTCELKV
jgi:hypothetical protein